MGIFNRSEKQEASPYEEADKSYPQNYPGTNGYADETAPYDPDAALQCPPHTTERKLLTRIDFHVLPFLCIMYRRWTGLMLRSDASS